jgi:hypothetical protein
MKIKSSNKKTAKPRIRVSDLKPKKDPRGGLSEFVIVKHVDKTTP